MKFFKQVSACTWSVAQLVNETLAAASQSICKVMELCSGGTLADMMARGPSTKARNQKPCVLEYMSNRKNPGNTKYVFDGHWLMEINGNCMKLLKTRGKRWDLPKLAIPLFKVMSSYFSNIHISDTQISHIIHSSSYIYKYSSFLQAIPPKFTIYHYCTNVW